MLDLGFGSGFMSCCMARMVGDAGHVTAVEHIQHLINLLLTKLKISYPKLYKLYRVMDVVGECQFKCYDLETWLQHLNDLVSYPVSILI